MRKKKTLYSEHYFNLKHYNIVCLDFQVYIFFRVVTYMAFFLNVYNIYK